MSTIESIALFALLAPMCAAFVYCLIVETRSAAAYRKSLASACEKHASLCMVLNCILREKYREIMIRKEKNNEN